MKRDVVDLFRRARKKGVPLIAIATSDQRDLAGRLFHGADLDIESEFPKLTWDCVRALCAAEGNEAGAKTVSNAGHSRVLSDMLESARTFPPNTMVIVYNAHLFLNEPDTIQAICNLRDPYCDGRTLVLLGPSFQMRPELTDVVVLDEPLPDDKAIGVILERLYDQTDGVEVTLDDERRRVGVDAARGLSAFASEQVFAMSLEADGLNVDDAWERKRDAVNQTRGLKFHRGGPTFDALGGLESFKKMIDRLVNGRKRPGCIVFMDETEKALAGATGGSSGVGDTSGVSQDFLGTFLTWMEERQHDGMIAVGIPGVAKSASGMAIGGTYGMPTITLDVGGLKGSYVGESERALREALKIIDSIAGEDGAFVYATCNREASLPPEFKRRFRTGTWYFDLPTEDERTAIWKIHRLAHEIPSALSRPDDDGWTGAEIRNCCSLAWRLDCSIIEASKYIIPVARSNDKQLAALRLAARNWLSASYDGPYTGPREAEAQETKTNRTRKVRVS